MAEKKEKTAKPAKIEKKVGVKKLPGLFKKAYTEEKFEKNIISKLYVPGDKTYVSGLFKPSKDKKGNKVLTIPADAEFTKKEIKRLKLLAADIKKNKGRIKVTSFIAVAAVLVAVGLAVTVFKNPVAKWGVRSAMQNIFGAKCDIGSVNVEIWGGQFTINSLQQASSSDDMKNIFQFDKLDLKFNVAQVLRGRFDAENIEVTGIAVNTDRTTSGKLLLKKKSAQEVEEKTDSTGFYDSLKSKCGTDTGAAKNAISDLFAMYDPSAITSNIKDNLQSQKVAKEVEEELKTIVEKWKNKPNELQSQVDDVKKSTSKLTGLDVNSVKDPASAAALLKELDEAAKSVKTAKDNASTTMSSFEGDQKRVKELQAQLNSAIKADQSLLSDQLSVFDVNKAKDAINGTINEAGYALLGKYYPYLKKLVAYAASMKGSSSSDSAEAKEANKKAVETAKKESKRYAGRYKYWKADRVPRILIEKAHGSGAGIEINATNISSDMNKRGEPWIIKGSYAQEKRVHNAGLTVDARSDSNAPLVAGTYNGNNFPMTLDLGKNVKSEGCPVFDGTSTVSAQLTAEADFSFTGSGSLIMNPVKVTSSALSSETADRIYSSALSSINSVNVSATAGFTEKDGVVMNISSNFDKLLAGAIKNVADKEMANVKTEAMSKLNDQLGSSDAASKYIEQFSGISSQLNSSKSGLDAINKQLDSKKSELQKKAASAATDKAKSSAASAAGSALKKLKK